MNNIPTPQKGSPISLNWGKAVTESCNAARAIGTGGLVRSGPHGFGEAPLPANRRDRRLQSKLTPFAIKLKPKTDDAEAQWIIYLPSEEILSYNNDAVIPFGDLTPIDGQDNWYALNIPLTGGIVYLNLSTGDESESGSESEESVPPTVEYSLESSEKTSIALARVAYDEQSKSASVYQYVTSALHLGGGSAGAAGEMLHPYKVRFSEEFWSWEIYLPTEECLVIGDVPASVTGGLDQSPAENNWYFLYDIPEDASEIRLNGELSSGSQLSSVGFSDSSNDPENYPNRFSYLIAKVDARRVTGQNITSAIYRGGRQVWVDPDVGETA